MQALRKAHPSLPITAYLRSEAHDDSLSHLGVGVVHGTFEDIDKIADLCSKHSIVVNAADSENVALTKAILDGLKRQKPQKPTLLHVSGGGNFFDGGNDGNLLESAKTWNVSQILILSLIMTNQILTGQQRGGYETHRRKDEKWRLRQAVCLSDQSYPLRFTDN